MALVCVVLSFCVGLFVASLIVAFFGGMIALAMPCCFSVLLPSYFASTFKRRIAILRMTLVFAAGIAAVLLPLALGASTLAQYLGSQHGLIFVGGGFLMIILGLLSLWGYSIFPQIHLPVNLKRTDAPSVFTLGVFSGVASSCCAPVLAGIVILTALSTSIIGALLVGLAYVLGMVSPLVVVAALLDSKTTASRFLQGRIIHIRFITKEFDIHSSSLIAGAVFVAVGILTVVLGFTNTMISTPGSDFFGIYQAILERIITNVISAPEAALVASVVLIAALVGIVLSFAKRRRMKKTIADHGN